MKSNSHYLAAISAFIVWGFIVLPLKQLNGYASTQILFYRVLLALLCLPFILLVFKRKALLNTWHQFKQATKKEQYTFLVCTILGSALLTGNWLSFIYVVNQVNIQTASFSYLLCPIITALLGFIILKEKLLKQQWLAIAISLGSCCLLGVNSLHNLLLSLLIAFTYAFYLISQRILKKYDKIVLLTIQIVLAFLCITSLGENFRGEFPTETYFYVIVFILSTVFTILPLFLNLYALKELNSATIGILMYINPLLNFGVAFIYFGEKASAIQITAYLLILISIAIYNIPTHLFSPRRLATKHKIHS